MSEIAETISKNLDFTDDAWFDKETGSKIAKRGNDIRWAEVTVLDKDGYSVDMLAVMELMIRELRLHKALGEEVLVNIKLDGRPFWGKNQVMVGIVPADTPTGFSIQSAKSVYPIAIANCKEDRENLKILLKVIINQKKILKKKPFKVDGKEYIVNFLVTVDYKTLLLLLVKKDDEDFMLGGKGVAVEFCFICNAIRNCKCHRVRPDETCLDCLKSKSNIGRSTRIRDDLTCLLDEELSSIQLCSLHTEMRNTEQLLGSVGLLAHQADALDELNAALKNYGPETSYGDSNRLQ
ncbi:uncharacterized protein LOC110246951 [Exaiptasia diaphana]|uniref:Uncharacterized protein n=1 Tax=Exaiptasia diaphana TaxID=2652724 RepID=A0A913XSG9_EXADI|nr:uncharacterized protein LOC110246951 [Exaiptasia diaphana]